MNTEILRFMNFYNFLLFNFLIFFFFLRKKYFLTHDIQFTHTHDQHPHPHPPPTTSTHYPPPPTFSHTHLRHKREEMKPESRLLFFVACSKSRIKTNNETKPPKRIETAETSVMAETTKQNNGRDQTSEQDSLCCMYLFDRFSQLFRCEVALHS